MDRGQALLFYLFYWKKIITANTFTMKNDICVLMRMHF